MQSKPCELCGATANVVDTTAYVGGRGYQQRRVCVERLGCWARFDQQQTQTGSGLAADTSQAA